MTKELTLENLCGGAVSEQVSRALRKVSDNILDPNTEPKKKREIVLKLTFNPNEDDREEVNVEAHVTTKLAPEMGASTQLFINRDLYGDTVTITECAKGQIKGQVSLDDYGFTVLKKDDQDTANNIYDYKKAQEG